MNLRDQEAGPSSKSSHLNLVSEVQDIPECSNLSRLLEKQSEEIETVNQRIQLYKHYRDDYVELKKLIDCMQDRTRYPHKVPIAGSKLAFVPSHIIHTNEFHVLLGDNIFALRSARQATQIVDRRLKDIEEKLKLSQEAKKKAEDWFKVTEEHKRDKEQFVEIVETM